MAEKVPSKRSVDRAGKTLRAARAGGEPRIDATDLDEARRLVELWRGLHAQPLSAVAAELRYYVREAGADERSVTQRLKRFDTVIEKLDRHPGTLAQMEDIGGVRVVLPDQPTVDAVVSSLRRRWEIRRVREYIDGRDPGPKPDGYRAVHVIVMRDERFIEIQLRTPAQDRWAQAVEKDTRRLGQALKFGGGAEDLREYFRMVAELMTARADGRSVPDAFFREMGQLYRQTAHYYDSEDDGAG